MISRSAWLALSLTILGLAVPGLASAGDAAKGAKLDEVLAGDKKRLERVKGLEPTPAPEPEEMFSSGNPDIFYSPLTRAIEGLKQGKGTPGDWANILKGLTTRGVKADEIEWSGVNDWLKAQGRDPFSELVVPATGARLLQWTGRALRTETDEAVVVCYDARLLRQSYGRRMLKGLPPYRLQRRDSAGMLTDVVR